MNTQTIISINPTCSPSGMNMAKEILRNHNISKRPISALKQSVRLILGITTSEGVSRRQWTFRVVLGSILMCFGLLFLHTEAFDISQQVMPGISLAMIAAGAFVACGLLTRIVSFGMSIILTMALCHIGIVYMTGFSILVCIGVCLAGIITGSGRYSMDTLLYNGLFSRRRLGQNCAF
ncbi:MAG: DoxX family protein [Muribaculum sp.]|nr:DoxX family protein [Muribaculum sp.]